MKIDAMTMMGEFLKAAPKNEGTRGQIAGAGPGRGKTGGTKTEPPVSSAPTLADAGISKRESSDAQLLAACEETGIDPVYAEFTGDHDDAEAFVDSQNLHRRHLTTEFRRQRVAELRAQGLSIRRIAATVGTSTGTVRNDLHASGVQCCTPGPTLLTLGIRPDGDGPPEEIDPDDALPPKPTASAKITGRDGKSYSATKPRPAKTAEREVIPAAPPADAPTPTPAKPTGVPGVGIRLLARAASDMANPQA